MLIDPLGRVMFGNEAFDRFRFSIGPKNINAPPRSGIFPRYESWLLLGHPSNMRPDSPFSSEQS
jgi:hypothetical protein